MFRSEKTREPYGSLKLSRITKRATLSACTLSAAVAGCTLYSFTMQPESSGQYPDKSEVKAFCLKVSNISFCWASPSHGRVRSRGTAMHTQTRLRSCQSTCRRTVGRLPRMLHRVDRRLFEDLQPQVFARNMAERLPTSPRLRGQ